MLEIKFNTVKAKRKFERMPQNLKKAVKSTSDNIKQIVYEEALPIAPRWHEVLRHSVLTESYDFVETDFGLSQHLVYDAWNPKTGFHYGELRYYETTSGVQYWTKFAMVDATPLVEKELIIAIKKGVGS